MLVIGKAAEFFRGIYDKINNWIKDLIKFDQYVIEFYNKVIAPLPEIVKIIGSIFLLIILVLGIFSFIKKFIKTSIVIGIVLVILILLFVLL